MIADEAFEQHRPVADGPRVPLASDHLRSGAAGDQSMESRDRAAGDGDEAKREYLAGENRTAPVRESGECRQLQVGPDEQNPNSQHQDNAKLDERAQVIAGCQQQPDRKSAGEKAVDNDRDGERNTGQREQRCELTDCATTYWPPKMLAITSTKPIAETSITLPGRSIAGRGP